MSETYLRQWAMLRHIPRQPHTRSALEIRQHLVDEGFRVDVRTVQRDLNTLSALFPLFCEDTQKPYGWSWQAQAAAFDLPGMDRQTALTFALAERFLKPLLPPASLRYLGPHFARAQEILSAVSPRLRGWPKKVRVVSRGLKLIPAEVRTEVLDTVYEALLAERGLVVAYTRRGETQAREYEISPLGLVFREAAIYLVCTFWEYTNLRHLALHRIDRAEKLDTACNRPPAFDLDRYIAENKFSYPLREDTIRLHALFEAGAAIHLYETPLSTDQKLAERRDGRVALSATMQDTMELRWWLQAFGDQVEVVKPKRLRDAFRAIACRLAETYKSA